jgi:hypothetical protein
MLHATGPYLTENRAIEIHSQIVNPGCFPDYPLVHHVPLGRIVEMELCPLGPVQPMSQLDLAGDRPD